MTEVLLNPQRLVVGFCRLKPVAQRKEHTVRVRGIETELIEIHLGICLSSSQKNMD